MTRRQVVVLIAGVILLVVAVTGGLAVRTTSTGPLVWTVALDGFPQSIAVDAQTHRAFITTVSLGFGAGNARMIVLDTDTGDILRRMALGGNGSSPPVLDERAGRVVVAAFVYVRPGPGVPGVAGIVRVLDARSGAPVRTVRFGLFPRVVAVDEQTGRAFVTSEGVGGGGLVGMLDTRTGRLMRIVHVGMEPQAQIVVDTRQGRVFVPVYSQRGYWHVSVLDARSGRPLYTIAAGKAPVWMAVDARTGRAFVVDGAGTDLRVLDTRSGHLLRTVLAGLHPSRLMVDEQTSRAFVPTDAGVSMLDTRSGVVLRNVAVGQGRLASLPLLDARSGRVFAVVMSLAQGPRPGSVIMLDARSGKLIRTVALSDSPGSVVVDERAGRVAVLTGGWPGTINHVTILDARTGAILRTLPVGVAASGMAVDERNGRVFVINGRGFVILPDSWAWLPVWLRRRLPFLPPPGRHSRIVPGGVSMIDPTR